MLTDKERGQLRAVLTIERERLGKNAKDAPFYPPGLALTAAKKALLDREAADREADYTYKRTQPAGRPGGSLGDGTAHGLAEALGSPRPDATIKIPN